MTKALDKQVGGNHYKELAIQPTVYIEANNLGFCEGNVVKYITRHHLKHGIEDIDKVIHYCELIKELKYNKKEITPKFVYEILDGPMTPRGPTVCYGRIVDDKD